MIILFMMLKCCDDCGVYGSAQRTEAESTAGNVNSSWWWKPSDATFFYNIINELRTELDYRISVSSSLLLA